MKVLQHTAGQVLLMILLVVSSAVHAGAYLFADEANGIDLIVHPSKYLGNGGVVTVRVCIDPASPNANDMVYSVQNNINTYNQLVASTGNISRWSSNNVPDNTLDFESVALHEIGHCLGLGHINAASDSGLAYNQQDYSRATDGVDNVFNIDAGADGVIGSSDDIRGDDVNLLWFRKSNNDPFTIDSVVDSTTYSRNLADLPAGHNFAANADRDVSALLGYVQTEAVMQQGTLYDEAQRLLGHDDVSALRYAFSGVDERESGGFGNTNYADDNYTVVLEYGGISTTNCDISMSITATSSLAFCSVNGVYIGTDHIRITTANIEFGQGFNWFFNAPNSSPVLAAIGDLNLTEGEVLVVPLTASDVDDNTLSFSSSALPPFATLLDNDDGTATLTLNTVLGDASSSAVTITVADNGEPVLNAAELFNINVAVLDSDGDGIGDYDEINVYFTMPDNPDSDGDFINDGDEINNAGDPLDPLVWPNFATGDIAPLGAPDGVVNAADYALALQIALGLVTATSLELAYADLYPVGSPDGVINISDLVLLLQLVW